jgi:hypothetical protein
LWLVQQPRGRSFGIDYDLNLDPILEQAARQAGIELDLGGALPLPVKMGTWPRVTPSAGAGPWSSGRPTRATGTLLGSPRGWRF